MIQLDKQSKEIIHKSKEIAKEYGLGYVGTEHLLLAIVCEGTNLGAVVLHKLGANEYTVQNKVDELIKERKHETWVIGRIPGTPHYRDLLSTAATEAQGTGNWQVRPEHLVLALLKEPQAIGYKTLNALGISVKNFREALTEEKKCPQALPYE